MGLRNSELLLSYGVLTPRMQQGSSNRPRGARVTQACLRIIDTITVRTEADALLDERRSRSGTPSAVPARNTVFRSAVRSPAGLTKSATLA